jgi:hypothetical protein
VKQSRGREGWLAPAPVEESTYWSSGGKPPFPTARLLHASRITFHASFLSRIIQFIDTATLTN